MSEKKKFLYAAAVSTDMQYSGILRKVAGQTGGMERLGWDAAYTCVCGNCLLVRRSAGEEKIPFPASSRWSEQQTHIAEAIGSLLAREPRDAVYIKGFLTNPYYLRIAKAAKEANPACKVVFEVATYPYWGEYKRFFRVDWEQKNLRSFVGHAGEVVRHGLTTLSFSRYVDTVVVFGSPVDRLWGIDAMTLDNGVDVEAIRLREDRAPRGGVNLLGVVGTSVAHGYDRILRGLRDYLDASPQIPVTFHVVGKNETIEQLKRLAGELSLGDSVRFLGYQSSDALERLYCENDAAVSSLGVYRIGLTHRSPLKSREYCASGIPFLYAYEDKLLQEDTPFALKLPNTDTPVSIDEVVRFVQKCRLDSGLPETERRFAMEHYDWKIIMREVFGSAESAS